MVHGPSSDSCAVLNMCVELELPTGGIALRLPASGRKHVSVSHQTDPGLRSGDWDDDNADWLSPDPPPPWFGWDLWGSNFWVLGIRIPCFIVDELVTRFCLLVVFYMACRTILDFWLGV